MAGSWFIQNASAQDPSGTLVLVAPSPDPAPDTEFVVSVDILNPQNVSVFTITVEYSDDLYFNSINDIQPAEGQFDLMDLTFGQAWTSGEGRIKRQLVLGINYNMGEPVFFSEGTLFTITFETSKIGNHWVAIIEDTHLQDSGLTVTELENDELPSVIIPVRKAGLAGTVTIDPAVGLNSTRLNETSFVDIVLSGRRRVNRYQITVDPSDNLGSLTVSYNADDSNGMAITNHTAGDPIMLSADLWLSNDPFIDAETGLVDENDWRVTHSDPIVATLFFTPTATGQGSFAITEAKIFDTDNTELTLSNPGSITFTIVDSPLLPDGNTPQITYNNTGVGPTPIITVSEGVKDGPFEIEIHFESDNAVEHVVNADASILWPRGVYGFARDEIEVGGTAGASVTTRLWEADGAQLYYARINPTETGAREVTLQIPAGVVYEVGTNLPNVASEIVTVSTNLTHPPWDVDKNGEVEDNDVELVEVALGQGLEERGENFALYVNTIEDPDGVISDEEYRRRDVNGDLYINQVDVDLVRMHIPDDGGAQGEDGAIGQEGRMIQGRSVRTPRNAATSLDASLWMPDKNLRRQMRRKFGITDDTKLTQARMTHLTSLVFINEQISDITGLEYAVNLTELVFQNTQISDLQPLSGLTSLESLKLVDNNISDVTPLSGLTNLTFLNVSGNSISDLTPLSGLTNLTELWATDNNISDVTPLANLTNLQKLRLADNSILDTSPLYPLTQGVLASVDITISQYPPSSTWMPDGNLRKRIRKALGITTDENFTQEQVATLTKLTATKARISDITGLEYATSLRKLDLRTNRISDIGSLAGLTELTELKIGVNNISDITAFAGLANLAHLGLAENEISDITALANLTNLKELWLRDNNISDITSLGNLTQLTRLNLEENEVSDISALGSLTNLKELRLWKNSISDIATLGNLTQLTYLNLKKNEISDISALGNLTQLTYLNLRYNEVSDISALGSLTNLKELWMADNNVSDVSALSGLTKLKKLGIVNNPILDTSPLYALTQGALKNIDITVSQYPPWDINEDGSVDATDSALVTAALGQTGADIADSRTDVNGDGTVDQNDLTLVTDNIGTDGGSPSSSDLLTLLDQETFKTLDRGMLESYLNALRAESDGSLKYERAIALLEHILAMTRPQQTQLLANYPNPFNPETWIPYQLANASNVQITIYDVRGAVVRRLDLGHQREGYYTHRSRAAYWDGRNGFGEHVASGIYFYQLKADNLSLLRKMVILK